MLGTVLIVDDEINMRKILAAMLKAEGYSVETVGNLAEARRASRGKQVILTDLRLKGENGMDLLQWAKEEMPYVPVIILTAHGTVDSAVDAMKQGAFDYVAKPFDRSELAGVIQKAVRSYQYECANGLKPVGAAKQFPLIGRNRKMLELMRVCEKVAATDSTVLITGESGTGKELIAQSIHEQSLRKDCPFIKINCAAIPNNLLESELFGYERGAFTGAVNSKPGRFELADTGTLFLDEIGEMSVEMQVKLLRVIQEQAFERVGGLRTIHVNVRLLAATNCDLKMAVASGAFREDLYYRLNVVPVALPPLRDRQEDIPTLIEHFLRKFSERLGKPVPLLEAAAENRLVNFAWPGNIRQLENVLERISVMSDGAVIGELELPEELFEFNATGRMDFGGERASLKMRVKQATMRVERQAIEEALKETSNNVTQAAKKLNISRKGLQLKMKELGLR